MAFILKLSGLKAPGLADIDFWELLGDKATISQSTFGSLGIPIPPEALKLSYDGALSWVRRLL